MEIDLAVGKRGAQTDQCSWDVFEEPGEVFCPETLVGVNGERVREVRCLKRANQTAVYSVSEFIQLNRTVPNSK